MKIIQHGETGHFCHGGCAGYAEGGTVSAVDEKDPSIIPEDIKEFVKKAHKDKQESRPDENWRIKSADKPESVAPYKKDEEAEESGNEALRMASGGVVPGYADGGPALAPIDIDPGDLQPDSTSQIPNRVPLPAAQPPNPAPIEAPTDEGPGPGMPPAPAIASAGPVAPAIAPAAPAPTEQDFMTKANSMLGLNPQQQAAFMKLLGSNAQKGQIGAGIAGIGDAIASGGTLGKVNPGNLARSEDLIQNKTKEGIEGMQTIRGNQEKTADLAQKLQAQDPNSPLSKYAQKAYGSIGKKLGIDLSHASASLISDVAGKGVEELNTEYQGDLKKMGLQLQKEQVEATRANQQGQRAEAEATRRGEAAKTLADRGIMKTLANAIPGTTGRAATDVLKNQAAGIAPDVLAYAQKHGITPEAAQAIKDKRTGGK